MLVMVRAGFASPQHNQCAACACPAHKFLIVLHDVALPRRAAQSIRDQANSVSQAEVAQADRDRRKQQHPADNEVQRGRPNVAHARQRQEGRWRSGDVGGREVVVWRAEVPPNHPRGGLGAAKPPKFLIVVLGKYTLHGGGLGAAKPPPQKSWLWCGAASPRRTITNVQHVLAQHKIRFIIYTLVGFGGGFATPKFLFMMHCVASPHSAS